ncbi:hypothetical protein [Tenggerimyces flavus]|uniref:Uncharacterized protein n=1 Tax=Tenggerimyces flavus TaxID=1708749 RepID=A0ABV7YNF1_9ACTN|nr:hypothetical protein [Tenggerimyces flavus]MBM7786295.1 hypothetical protein [Tenggerimyces flavus]
MYQYLDNTARYEALVREASHDHLAHSVRASRPRQPLLGWVTHLTTRVLRLA